MSRLLKNPFVLALLALLVFAVALAWFRVGPQPEIAIEPGLPGIGPRTPITVRAAEPTRGLSGLTVELVQGEKVTTIAEKTYEPRPFWAFWGPRVESDEIEIEVGREVQPDLAAGTAQIRVSAERAPTWLRHPDPAVVELELPVRLTPPTVSVLSRQVYLAQGGSSVVVYAVGPETARDGVRVGELWFPGYPLPGGGEHERFALFGAPHDLTDGEAVRLAVADELGNTIEVGFLERYLDKPLSTDTIELSDAFMGRVVPQIMARSPEVEDRGDLLQNYLAVNRDLRQSNAESLRALAEKSRPAFLWNEPFLPLPNAQAMASYADRRTYLYNGEKVDQQDHLGFDLASVRQAPVIAANSGVVIMAEYFGIYGNTVVVDHGYGLMSLYAHLSSFAVEPGQEVARGDELGRTGETGLAGGDHLHFSILLHGLQVNPLEWWDPSWIRNRIQDKLGAAFEQAGTEPEPEPEPESESES